MTALIEIPLKIKESILACFPFFQCGYENVKELRKGLKLNAPNNGREYESILFSDQLGNYFWVEKKGEITTEVKGALKESDCSGVGYIGRQRYSIFAMCKGYDETKLFECLLSCIASISCVRITGGEYDSIAVITKELAGLPKEYGEKVLTSIGNISDFAIVRVDVTTEILILPTDFSTEGCECEPCKSC